MTQPEFWLRGPVPGVPLLLQPVAHALLQSRAEVESVMAGFEDENLWVRPAGVASVGFHLQHLRGVVDRLFAYARGAALSSLQLRELAEERQSERVGVHVSDLVSAYGERIDRAIDELRSIDPEDLLEPRGVGRKQLPSNVLGLLFHAAEHAQRHTGQLLVTVRVVRDAP